MNDRGKKTAMERRRNDDASFYYSSPFELSCRRHSFVSASYSFSDISLNRTSNATVDVEDVLRISSLIDKEATKQRNRTRTEEVTRTKEVVVFRRSSSSCVNINKTKHHIFSRLGRFFRKMNPRKERVFDEKNSNDNNFCILDDKKQCVWKPRSLCSFRGGNRYFIGSEEDMSSYSGARSFFSATRT